MEIVHYFRGESADALRHRDRFNEIYDPVAHRTLVSVNRDNFGVVSWVWAAWALWVRGYADRSLETSQEAVSLAREAKQPFSLAYALAWASVVHFMRREREPARDRAEAAIEIAETQGFPILEWPV